MSHFNSPKNPPWARPNEFTAVQNQPQQHMINPNLLQYNPQNVGGAQQQVYQAQMAIQQQALSMQQFVNTTQQIYNPAVSGISVTNVARPMNIVQANPVTVSQNNVLQQPSGGQQQSRDSGSSNTAKQQRVFTGTVTKVVDTYGFVDEDVFFQMSCVKGPRPVLHDRVLVEAVCLPTMPFKWNATRVQVLIMADNGNTRKRPLSPRREERPNYPEAAELDFRRDRVRERERERERERDREPERNRAQTPDAEERRRRRERREKDEKEREREKDSRARSRTRSRSPRRARQSPVKKYRVRIPDHSLDVSEFTMSLIKARYSSLYIPSDFFSACCRWPDAVPPQRPLQLAGPTRFHIIDKDIDPVFPREDVVEPPDADFLYSAKVMMLTIPSKEELIRRCVQLAEEKEPNRRMTHAARLVDCVVGVNTRSKNEYMAIGGPWSASLDGADPVGDPSVLIKTAIRCCRALTGVDLTPVTKWYRFAELHYHRAKTTYKGKEVPPRVETVVLYIPDTWAAMPSALEWDGLHLNYQRALDARLAEIPSQPDSAAAAADDDKEAESAVVEVKEPTHWSKIDMKTIKVAEMREELVARNLSAKGLRLQLIARLGKVLKQEQDTEEEQAKERKEEVKNEKQTEKRKDKPKEEEKKAKEKDEKDKEAKDKTKDRASIPDKYKLPETPHIIVHPCKKAKSGKFNCKVVCLSLLLDYNNDVNKEHTFEVSLFAESLNEMLMRDFGLEIYQALCHVPEKVDDKEKKEEVKDEEKTAKDGEKPDVEMDDKSNDEVKKESKDGKKEEGEKNGEDAVVNGKDEDSEEKRRKRRNGDKDKDKEREKKKKEKVPHQTINPDLLLAFSYFDIAHYGKITVNDLEELLQTLGLHLSRSQIKKLVAKLPVSDSYVDYRKLTDIPVPVKQESEDAEKTELAVPSLAELVKQEAGPLPTELGNKPLMPNFSLTPVAKEITSPPAKRTRRSDKMDAQKTEAPAEGFVMYNGSLLNVANLMEQLTKNESARLEAEQKALDLKHDLDDTKNKLDTIQTQLSKTKKDLHASQKSLTATKESLSSEKSSSDLYLTTLMDIQERIMPILDTDEMKRLCLARQKILGAPKINLVPLAKLEDIELDDVEMEDNEPDLTAVKEEPKK